MTAVPSSKGCASGAGGVTSSRPSGPKKETSGGVVYPLRAMSRTNSRPVAVIAALEQEAHVLVSRMPRAESVGPRLSVWESGGLVVMVAGVGKVAAAMAAQYACDVLKPRCVI